MRLDLLLKQTGIIKRRSVAKTLVETGHAMINDKVAKPSSEVKNDDVISLRLGARVIVAKISFTMRGTKEIPTYEIISSERQQDAS